MNFPFLSKQNCAVALFLLFVIIISESHIIDYFFNNSLGRAIFILFILVIAYLNNILGVICVLFAILLLSKKENKWVENFTNSSENTSSTESSITPTPTSSDTPTSTSTPTTSSMETPTTTSMDTPTTTTMDPPTTTTMTTPTTTTMTTPTTTTTNSTENGSNLDPSGNEAIEGFDILGTENNLKRGKKSNSIPVSNQIRKSEKVDAYYNSSFGNSYSLY